MERHRYYGVRPTADHICAQPAIRLRDPFTWYATFSIDDLSPMSLQYTREVQGVPEEEEEDEEEQNIIELPVEPTPKRKRGRPRISRRASEASSLKKKVSQRVPYNQVERKYRQMLNAEMERLRLKVPTLPQHTDISLAGPPKPSKATVLAAAVDYIKLLEADTKRLSEENEELRCKPVNYNGG